MNMRGYICSSCLFNMRVFFGFFISFEYIVLIFMLMKVNNLSYKLLKINYV